MINDIYMYKYWMMLLIYAITSSAVYQNRRLSWSMDEKKIPTETVGRYYLSMP